jgi:AcrR family transcriptional regulator
MSQHLLLIFRIGAIVTLSGVAGPDVQKPPAPGGKGDRTRRRVLEIAIRRFAADGFRRTSVSDIAREAGISPASTYAYFASKEALFEAAVDADAAALIDEARHRMVGVTVRDRWLPWLGVLVELVPTYPLAARVLSGREPEVLSRLLNLASLERVRNELADDLRTGQRRGEVRSDVDADEIALGIETYVLAILMAYLQAQPQTDDKRALSVVALLDAVLKPPPTG